MKLDHGICYRALRTRDARFDGRFFTGVTSTGVYCRPVCPARTPGAANCTFFACAAAAEEAGFRPCRRCRPETAPGTPAWRGTSTTVSRALRLIDDGALDGTGVDTLAARLGIGDRHLRRLFAEHLGSSPLAVAQTRRVHFAKRMIEESTLPMTRIALVAGYRNVRRFNAAVRRCFDRTPSEIRRRALSTASKPDRGTVTLRLAARAPFDWPRLLAWLAPRAIPGVEQIDDGSYRRTIQLDDCTGVIEVQADPDASAGLLLLAPIETAPVLARAAGRVRRLCDLDADAAAITEQLGADPLLASAARRHPEVRIPGCWDRFELAVRAVLGQQVSVGGASTLAGRLAEHFGHRVAGRPGRCFPSAEDLADADITSIGMPAARAETIRTIARAVCTGEPILDLAPDLGTAIDRLRALPGVGDWTAQYIAMRALREPDAFPAGDLGLRKALATATTLPTEAAVRRRAEAWRPWRAYAAMLLWHDLARTIGKDE